MKKIVKKTIGVIAGSIFVVGLTMNVAVTMNNPFELMSNTAMAQTSGGSTSGPYYCYDWCQDASGWRCELTNPATGKTQICRPMRKKQGGSS